MADFFEDLESTPTNDNRKPFFAIDLTSEDAILKWLKEEISLQRNNKFMRNEKTKNNLLRYKGIQYQYQRYQPRDMPDRIQGYNPQFVAPLIRDAVDERVAKITEFKPSVAVIPQSDEEQDKVDAKIAKRFLQHIDRQENLDSKVYKFEKYTFLAGQAFITSTWNPDKGPKHPLTKLSQMRAENPMLQMGMQPELQSPEQMQNAQFQQEVTGAETPTPFIGDVEDRVYSDFDVYFEQEKRWEDVSWADVSDYIYTESLKRDYPHKAESINSDTNQRYFDFELFEDKTLGMKTIKHTFWYKPDKYLPDGFEVVYCNDVVLKMGKFPYKHGKLPIVRNTDIDLMEEANAESTIQTTKGYAAQFNNMTNQWFRAINMVCHPKWFVQEGSVDKQQLNNDITIVTVKKGASPPTLAQPPQIPPGMLEARRELKEEFYFFNKSNSIVRGEPPPGITAFVALQYMGEQESRRQNQDIVKYNNVVRDIYELNLKTAAQFYKKEDERTMMILSKDNRFEQMSYDPSSLQKDFAVVLQNQTALPDSKSVRTQFILDMGEKFPGLFSNEQIIEMMNLGQSEKFMDLGSAAVRAAEAENEMILDGNQIPDPEAQEFHVQHWKSHVMAIQSIGFKTKTTPQVKQAMIDHLTATEMLMMEQIQKNPVFSEMVMRECPQFPMFFAAPPPPPLPPMPPPMPGPNEQVPPEQMQPEMPVDQSMVPNNIPQPMPPPEPMSPQPEMGME